MPSMKEIVCAVEKISERYLIPVLEQLLDQFPFIILGFFIRGDELLTQTFENDPELFQDSHHLLDASIAYADLNGDWSLTLGEMRIPGQGA